MTSHRKPRHSPAGQTTPITLRLRRVARRKGVFRAMRIVPIVPLLLGMIAFDVWSCVRDPETLRETFGQGLVFVALPIAGVVLLIESVINDVAGVVRKTDPSIVSGRLGKKEEVIPMWEPLAPFIWSFRLYTGGDIELDAPSAYQLCPDGEMRELARQETAKLRVTRRIYKKIEQNEQVDLLCTPGGRGCKLL